MDQSIAPAVRLRHVSVELGHDFVALKDITAELPEGQIIGFIGPSGAGKTTLMRSIVGRQKVSHGEISVFGQSAGTALLRSQVSYMTQEVSVYADLTVTENLRYFAVLSGLSSREIVSQVHHILKVVDMTAQAGQLVATLSSGQKQRVSLAIALIGQPKLLVLDEPTIGLDPVLRQQLWEIFHELAKNGRTLIISSHVMDEAERCDDLLLIRNGNLLAHGSPAELRRQTGAKNIEESFLKLVGGRL